MLPLLPFLIAPGWFLVLGSRNVWVVPDRLPWMLAEGLLWPMALVYLRGARVPALAQALALAPLAGLFTEHVSSAAMALYGLFLFELLFTLPGIAGVAIAVRMRRWGFGWLPALGSAAGVVLAFRMRWL